METGLRPGEVCALQWQDIDFKGRRALIRRTYSESRLREKTKQKREQWIPLSDRACEIVERQRGRGIEGTVKHEGVCRHTSRPDDKSQVPTVSDLNPGCIFLFLNPVTHRGYTYKTLNRLWNRHSGTDVDLYEGTRHSFVTQMMDVLPIQDVQRLARHTDIRSTQVYDHSGDHRQREALNRRSNVIEMKERKK
jgi:integrase